MKNHSRWRFATILFALILPLCSLAACRLAQDPAPEPLTEKERALNIESFDVVWTTIRDKHWDPQLGGLDWRGVRDRLRPRVEAARARAEYTEIVHDMIAQFKQSHFALVPADVQDDLAQDKGGEGETGLDVRVIDGAALVTRVETGSPAAALGVATGWELLQAGGRKISAVLSVAERAFPTESMRAIMSHHAVVHLLTGPVGSKKAVRLRDGSGKKTTLEIELAAPKGNRYQLGHMPAMRVWIETRRLDESQANIGYIVFNAFMDPIQVSPAFNSAIQSFMECDGVIIDVRGNGGGMPIMASGMAGWLVDTPEQYFGEMRTRQTTLKYVINPRGEVYKGPLAILIDGSSASCSEIFADGLRDMGRARLFGSRTAGAVLPAIFTKLPNGDFFYYPIADYFSSGGARLEGVGVAPDTAAPHDRASLLAGRDNAMEAAKKWIIEQKNAKQ